MSLAAYASRCTGFVTELSESLDEADLHALRADCKSLGLLGWLRWYGDSYRAIVDFVEATPSERRKKKAWQGPVLRRRLTLAAIHHVRMAEALLRASDILYLRLGVSYRQMVRLAGHECFSLHAFLNENWPFEGTNPFA